MPIATLNRDCHCVTLDIAALQADLDAAVGGIVASLAYYAISGGDIAALRSTVMIVLVFGAVLAGRRALTMRNVAIAGMVTVLP